MPALANRPFWRMNGAGNAILVVDLRGSNAAIEPDEARAAAADPATRFDQLMAIRDPARAGEDARIEIVNADGSDAGACGNGMRCVAHVLLTGGAATDDEATAGAPPPDAARVLRLRTRAGVLRAWAVGSARYAVDMGPPKLGWADVPLRDPFHDTRFIELQVGPIDAPVLHTPAALSMGNPHAVFFVDDVDAHDLSRVGPLLENHPIFPDRANISLAAVEAGGEGEPDRIRLKVWERGAGLTLACGSAACAALVSAARRGLTGRRAVVALPGGELDVLWEPDRGGEPGAVVMTGPVAMEAAGRMPAAGADERAA